MRPHPRILKAIKWVGLPLSAWMLIVWLVIAPAGNGVWMGQRDWPFLRYVPFWTPFALTCIITVIAWHLDSEATLRARLNPRLCRKCGYDRSGLRGGAGAVCPECGKA